MLTLHQYIGHNNIERVQWALRHKLWSERRTLMFKVTAILKRWTTSIYLPTQIMVRKKFNIESYPTLNS